WDHVLGGGITSDYAQVFCAAKGGVYSFSRALAHSVAPRIRVNVLGPGWIETAYGSGLDPAVKQRIAAKIPLGRWGTPEDIAHAAVYLASGGITDKDFELARKIDETVVWRPKGGALEGTPNKFVRSGDAR